MEVAKPSFRRILANRPFGLLWVGQLVSQSGDYIFDVVALWLVLQLTGDIFKVGLTTATIFLPAIIIAPFAGVFVDRANRRDIIFASNLFQAATVGGIAVLYALGRLDFLILLALLFLLNAGAQFVRPAISATIPAIVEKEDLAPANSLFSIRNSMNQIAGFSIGGIMVLLLGIEIPIYYDSLTFIFAAATIALIAKSRMAVPTIEGQRQPTSGISFREKFLEGLRFIRTSRFLLEIIALAIVLNFFAGGVQTLLAPYSKLTVNGTAGTYGALLAAFALGTVLGSIAVGKIESRRYVGKLLFLGVFLAGGAIALIGLTTVAVYAFGLMLLIGVALALANLPLQVLIQAKVPGNMLGRVFTSLGALVQISTPIAAVTTGSVASSLTIGSTLLIYGLLMALVTGGSYFVFSEIREAKY